MAHCTNPLITMSDERSEANAKLVAAAPLLFKTLRDLSDATNDTWRTIKQSADAVLMEIERGGEGILAETKGERR